MYERYRTGKITREKFADIQYKDAQEVERLTKRAVEIEELISKRMEEREKRVAGEKTANEILLLEKYDPEVIRYFVQQIRVFPGGEIELDMKISSGLDEYFAGERQSAAH